MMSRNLQLDPHGRLRHFLSIEGLKRALLVEILDLAESFAGVTAQTVKKVPLLRGKPVVNLFFESRTRTRTTFELAAKRLSAAVLNLNITASATTKGETLLDTLRNLEAMHCDMFVVRHAESGAAHFIAANVAPHVHVVNAGDGRHAHPTQAMLDMFTIRRVKGEFAPLTGAIVGDILHSRVARSQIHALTTLGVNEVRVIGPKTLIPTQVETLGVHVFNDLRAGLDGVDVIIALRLQSARTQGLKGERISEMGALKAAGCVGVSNAGRAITNTLVLRRAMEYAATHDLTVFLHAEDLWLRNQGCVHEGQVSTRLGLAGIPEAAETVA